MSSKRSHEGYLLIDNSNNEGVPDELLRTMPIALPTGAGRGKFEAAIVTCAHCQIGVVINPLRNRERAYCRKCDHYLCDTCGAAYGASGGECKLFRKKVDELQEADALAEQRGDSLIILP